MACYMYRRFFTVCISSYGIADRTYDKSESRVRTSRTVGVGSVTVTVCPRGRRTETSVLSGPARPGPEQVYYSGRAAYQIQCTRLPQNPHIQSGIPTLWTGAGVREAGSNEEITNETESG